MFTLLVCLNTRKYLLNARTFASKRPKYRQQQQRNAAAALSFAFAQGLQPTFATRPPEFLEKRDSIVNKNNESFGYCLTCMDNSQRPMFLRVFYYLPIFRRTSECFFGCEESV